MMTKREEKDVRALLDYTWADEEKHYQSGPSKDHIFIVLKRLAKKIGYQVP
ncbi:MAG: hypothetical protein KKF80_01095 [Candidatus Omnitrophica bacterium]|nr:hypothetical protein [Candidatus Omnitrophota bacterium]